MRPQQTVDRKPDIKPEIHSPATPITAPGFTFNPNATVLELILKLRSCFQLKDSEEVAAILQRREDNLKQTITDLKVREDTLNSKNIELKNQLQCVTHKCASLEANRESFGAERERIEEELRKCKKECEVYRDDKLAAKYELEKVRLDLKMWREKEDMAAERYEKRIREMERESEAERERERREMEKVREELERERGRREEEVGRLMGDMRGLIEVKRKAEEASRYWERSFKQCEPRVVKLEKELLMLLRSEPGVMKVVEKTPSLRGILDVNRRSVIRGNPDLIDENAHASPCAGSTAESPMIDTYGPAETGPRPSVMMASRSRMSTDAHVVIEIDDSDDDNRIMETASASKTDIDYGRSEKLPASQSISRGKHPLVCTKNNGGVGDANGSNKSLKRKMDSAFPKKDENSDSSDESTSTKGIEKLVSQILKNKPFKSETEMLTAFNKNDELCLNAFCALHRADKSDKLPRASQYRGFSVIDATRVNQLAKFLVDGDPQGKLRKTVKDLQQYDSKGIDECRKLARNNLAQIYQIYQREDDLLFKEYLVKNYPKKTIS